ncbi:histidine kinase, putative [Babesia ovata]|uniref:Histidine kinase, putative n=1 Tax=Babesia ovata TaxID=189622 RepID=A0A2H6KIP7_9APIC|nr:histidine kinase, putative [Babesia ovata]GBE62858.1 histidine kinase, putative [Babesia ovata]
MRCEALVVKHRVGDVERGDDPECCEAEEEGHTDAVEELVDLAEKVGEVVGVDDLAELRAEITAIFSVIAVQGSRVSKCKSVCVKRRQDAVTAHQCLALAVEVDAMLARSAGTRRAPGACAVNVLKGVEQLLEQVPESPCGVYDPRQIYLRVLLGEGVVGVEGERLEVGGAGQ